MYGLKERWCPFLVAAWVLRSGHGCTEDDHAIACSANCQMFDNIKNDCGLKPPGEIVTHVD